MCGRTDQDQSRKVRALPIVIPLLCLGETPWIPVWLEVRKSEDLFSEGHVAPGTCLLLPTEVAGPRAPSVLDRLLFGFGIS